ncbi:MBOAT family O-acyltransferase [Candidatus Magnetomonas plexicatena]|uniref:MBOAT family O-acyltransferase n=1 Tax=Candidatus Magnetomonas plexicatena TaxID=2552947 RepID=UPI001C76879F|nr:MBOAT family protein [Nitrospirales bacterium LBB_01]
MLFNSLQFLIFFPVVTVLYFALPQKYRNLMLLAASTIFYMAFVPAYILILATLIAIDYICGILIENSPVQKKRRYLLLSIAATCLMLFVFKYFNFFVNNVSFAAHLLHVNCSPPVLNILLPLGLSFHTFQSLSYIIEVYKGKQKAERNLLIYALYVMFYPQLVAGPIERPQNLLKQFYEEHTIDYVRITNGLKLMTYGLFKKVVVADRLAAFVDAAYISPQQHAGVPMIIAAIFFSFQIFCDFSGYTDIALGSAEVMGFRLMQNFRQPYFSRSISEFWKRWHISLTSWLRDYIYNYLTYRALHKKKCTQTTLHFNVILVFLICGLWHGANWTYIVFGFLHGFYIVTGDITRKLRKTFVNALGLSKLTVVHKVWQISVVFTLVTFSLIIFRSKNLSEAFFIIKTLFINIENITNLKYMKSLFEMPQFKLSDLIISVLSILLIESIHFFQTRYNITNWFAAKPLCFRWSFYYAGILTIIFLGVFNNNRFIYFAF